jgi:hypothetical protein
VNRCAFAELQCTKIRREAAFFDGFLGDFPTWCLDETPIFPMAKGGKSTTMIGLKACPFDGGQN